MKMDFEPGTICLVVNRSDCWKSARVKIICRHKDFPKLYTCSLITPVFTNFGDFHYGAILSFGSSHLKKESYNYEDGF